MPQEVQSHPLRCFCSGSSGLPRTTRRPSKHTPQEIQSHHTPPCRPHECHAHFHPLRYFYAGPCGLPRTTRRPPGTHDTPDPQKRARSYERKTMLKHCTFQPNINSRNMPPGVQCHHTAPSRSQGCNANFHPLPCFFQPQGAMTRAGGRGSSPSARDPKYFHTQRHSHTLHLACDPGDCYSHEVMGGTHAHTLCTDALPVVCRAAGSCAVFHLSISSLDLTSSCVFERKHAVAWPTKVRVRLPWLLPHCWPGAVQCIQ